MPVHSLSENFQFSSNWQWNHSPKIQKQPTPPSLTIAFFLVWPPLRHGPSHRDTTKTSLYGTIASDTVVVPFLPFLRSIAPRCDVTSVPSKIPRRTFARFFISPKPPPAPPSPSSSSSVVETLGSPIPSLLPLALAGSSDNNWDKSLYRRARLPPSSYRYIASAFSLLGDSPAREEKFQSEARGASFHRRVEQWSNGNARAGSGSQVRRTTFEIAADDGEETRAYNLIRRLLGISGMKHVIGSYVLFLGQKGKWREGDWRKVTRNVLPKLGRNWKLIGRCFS